MLNPSGLEVTYLLFQYNKYLTFGFNSTIKQSLDTQTSLKANIKIGTPTNGNCKRNIEIRSALSTNKPEIVLLRSEWNGARCHRLSFIRKYSNTDNQFGQTFCLDNVSRERHSDRIIFTLKSY